MLRGGYAGRPGADPVQVGWPEKRNRGERCGSPEDRRAVSESASRRAVRSGVRRDRIRLSRGLLQIGLDGFPGWAHTEIGCIWPATFVQLAPATNVHGDP